MNSHSGKLHLCYSAFPTHLGIGRMLYVAPKSALLAHFGGQRQDTNRLSRSVIQVFLIFVCWLGLSVHFEVKSLHIVAGNLYVSG